MLKGDVSAHQTLQELSSPVLLCWESVETMLSQAVDFEKT